MTGQATIEFWYEFASTYSYPAAMTITERAAARGVCVRWRPFLLGPIFASQGWHDSPFNLQPEKGRYMWRDIERLCAAEGLAFHRPDVFPQHSLLAARLALALADRGLLPDFTRHAYQAQFADREDISNRDLLMRILADVGADPLELLAKAESEPLKQRLRDAVDEAKSLGIFGAPSFIAGGELFWGFDRMDMALDHACGGPGGG